MCESAFDNKKYFKLQLQSIIDRIKKFDNKLYLEFGGKIFDDYHASRVLPGFVPDNKIKMLSQFIDKIEVVIVVNAEDIKNHKERNDFCIKYSDETKRLINLFRQRGFYIKSLVITKFIENDGIICFINDINKLGINVYKHYVIDGYPYDIDKIISDDGYGKNEYIKTTKQLILVTAPGPGSGKMAVCLSQMYHDYKQGIQSGYAKYETFPIWNLSINHPINLAYEAATADLNDINVIDNFHLDAYKQQATSYNRDIEIFPVLKKMIHTITAKDIYNSPTDMGVNMAGFCIANEKKCIEASKQEIIRRYYNTKYSISNGQKLEKALDKICLIIKKLDLNLYSYDVVRLAIEKKEKYNKNSCALILANGDVFINCDDNDCNATVNAMFDFFIKYLNLSSKNNLIQSNIIKNIKDFKKKYLLNNNTLLDIKDVLMLLMQYNDTLISKNFDLLVEKLKNAQLHYTAKFNNDEYKIFKKLLINATCEI